MKKLLQILALSLTAMPAAAQFKAGSIQVFKRLQYSENTCTGATAAFSTLCADSTLHQLTLSNNGGSFYPFLLGGGPASQWMAAPVGIGGAPGGSYQLQIVGAGGGTLAALGVTTTGQNASYIDQANNVGVGGGNTRIGSDSSAGGILASGSSPYSSVVGNTNAYSLHLITSNTVRATIDNAGNFGIGGAPGGTYKLETIGAAATSTGIGVTGTTTARSYFNAVNTAGNSFFGTDSNAGGALGAGTSPYSTVLGSFTATSLHLITGNNVRATIDSSGNVGVGAAPTSSRVSVTGTSGNATAAFYNSAVAGSSFGLYIAAGGNASDYALALNDRSGSTALFRVLGSGDTQIGTGSITLQNATNGKIFERGRSVAMGEWTSFTPVLSASTGTFTANTSIARYNLVGKMMTIEITLTSGTVSGTPQYLSMTIPAGLTGTSLSAGGPVSYSDNGTVGTGWVQVSGSTIQFYKNILANANWSTSTSSTYLGVTLPIEVQ